MIVGIKKPKQLQQLKAFKSGSCDLLIGLLFVLVARLICRFCRFFSRRLVGITFNCAIGSALMWSSRRGELQRICVNGVWLSWVAPRKCGCLHGFIVCDLVKYEGNLVGDAQLLESFVYTTICATVLIQGLRLVFLRVCYNCSDQHPATGLFWEPIVLDEPGQI